jgi:hypothetical protein
MVSQVDNSALTDLLKNSSIVSVNRTTVEGCTPAEYRYFLNVLAVILNAPLTLMFIYRTNKAILAKLMSITGMTFRRRRYYAPYISLNFQCIGKLLNEICGRNRTCVYDM